MSSALVVRYYQKEPHLTDVSKQPVVESLAALPVVVIKGYWMRATRILHTSSEQARVWREIAVQMSIGM